MLGRLILILLQVIITWFAAPIVAGYVPVPGAFSLFLFAIIAAIIVFLVGVLAAQVLRDVGQPGTVKLTWALVFALIAAAVVALGPTLLPHVPWGRVSPRALVVAAAVLGYFIKR